MQNDLPPLPIGRSGAMRAEAVTNVAGDPAVLVREGERTRALLASTRTGDGEALLVMPLDEEVEVRVDGDALAMYIASGSVPTPGRGSGVPGWASTIGLVLLLVIVGFAVLGSFTFFGWLVDAIGLR
ncbi:MAG TPA: hypothetical protein VFQ81_10325 [Candidatus Limnocylindria bacterium]|nr:hypothetical protein [Candidatus Limnocylindria bacterium]